MGRSNRSPFRWTLTVSTISSWQVADGEIGEVIQMTPQKRRLSQRLLCHKLQALVTRQCPWQEHRFTCVFA